MSELYKLMRRLDAITGEFGHEEYEETVDIFATDLGTYVPDRLPSQTPIKAFAKNAKAASKRSKASLAWNTQWSRERNISQLLSNAMRMRADDLELEFEEDGYVPAAKFIEVVNECVGKYVGDLNEDALKHIIVGDDTEDIAKANESKWQSGMGERHQFCMRGDTMLVRCMQGHLSKFYGTGPGFIKLEKIFTKLKIDTPHKHAFHDTKYGNIDGINGAGLISNVRGDDGRFIHLWVDGARKKGRKNQDVTYTVDVHAAMKGGVVFYQAANGVVLVETCVPRQYLTKCDVHIDKTVVPKYIPFYESSLKTNSFLMQFAADLWLAKDSNNGMKTLWRVLWPTIEKCMESCSNSEKLQYGCAKWEAQGSDHRFKLHIRFSDEKSGLGIRLLMINGKSDFDLIKLGKTYGFPRGCPVLWKPGEYVDLRGFFPKFENDENGGDEAPAFKEEVLDGASSLYFFKKWSGFLLHVIAFRQNGSLYWTVCSKQAADPASPFVIRGRDMMAGLLKDELLERLADDHLYLGGEAMHVDDEHGYVARDNAVVVTCVGKGTFWNKLDRSNGSASGLMEYLSSAKVVDFCKTYKLTCDSSYTLTADALSLKRAVLGLLEDRDLLRNKNFEEFISNPTTSFVKTNGTASHATLVGDVLEGFVFHVNTIDGRKHTMKVKLPFYTWRTMFLRAWLDTVIGKGSASVEGKQFVTKDCASRIDAFVRRWCFTQKGRILFQKLLKCAAVKLQTQWPLILSGNFGWMGGKVAGRVHVIIADTVEGLYFSEGGLAVIEQEAAEFDVILDAALRGNAGPLDDVLSIETCPVTICICVGPIGSGKSTFMKRLFASNPEKFEIVDGDMVVGRDLPEEKLAIDLTLSLSTERKPTTLSRVWEAVMRGKIPLVSHGGGVFVTFGRRKGVPPVCKLKERVRQVFGVETNLVVILMRDSTHEEDGTRNLIQVSDKAESSALIDSIYNDTGNVYMHKVFMNRSSTKAWSKGRDESETTFVQRMSNASSGNAHSALAIISVADTVFTAPFRPGKMDEWQASVTESIGLDAVLRCLQKSIRRSGYFQQLRAIVKEQVDSGEAALCKHVTLDFNADGFEFNSDEFDQLVGKLEGMLFDGKRYLMRFHPEGATAFDTSGLPTEPDAALNPTKPKEVDMYELCKDVSVVHVPEFIGYCKNKERIPHITEDISDFPARESVNIIKYFLDEPSKRSVQTLRSRAKGDFKFEAPREDQVYYEEFKSKGKTVGQRKLTVRGNYVAGTENVTFECIGISVFGHDDLD